MSLKIGDIVHSKERTDGTKYVITDIYSSATRCTVQGLEEHKHKTWTNIHLNIFYLIRKNTYGTA